MKRKIVVMLVILCFVMNMSACNSDNSFIPTQTQTDISEEKSSKINDTKKEDDKEDTNQDYRCVSSNDKIWDLVLSDNSQKKKQLKKMRENSSGDDQTRTCYMNSDTYCEHTDHQHNIYTIEFQTDDNTPEGTYWCLFHAELDMSRHAKNNKWKNYECEGTYGGLQNTPEGLMMINSFWDTTYKDINGESKLISPTLMDADGKGERFDNEGHGVKYIHPFKWEANTWYRVVIRTWENIDTKTTWFGSWIENRETEEIHRIAIYDTHMQNCFLENRMSFFLEDFMPENICYTTRTMRVRNMYFGMASTLFNNVNWCPITSINCDFWKVPEWPMKGEYRITSSEDGYCIMTTEYGDKKLKSKDLGLFKAPEGDSPENFHLNNYIYE